MGGIPPPPPPSSSSSKLPGAWRKKYRPPSTEASTLADARAVFGDLPDGLLRLAIAEKAECGRVGLANAGATCYMNSLLQALYHLPAFRAGIYQFQHDPYSDGDPDRCIPHQLGSLFASLQASDRKAINTSALTSAFGWNTPQHFSQSDVQEFCRVLFDALDQVYPTKALVSPTQLFHFTAESFVHCPTCETHSARLQEYLDLSIPASDVTTLYAGIAKYLQPEFLIGDNQYACEPCGTRVDAAKGIKILDFPDVLSISLGRFTYSPVTFTKVKLNHLVSFPRFLDVTPFGPAVRDAFLLSQVSYRDLDWIPTQQERQDPNTYVLSAVLVHSGGAMGGHYYGYCATDDPDIWVHANDSEMALVDWSVVTKAFGHDPNDDSLNHLVGANAYMLLYSRTSPLSSVAKTHDADAPPSLLAPIHTENQEHAKLLQQFKAVSQTLLLNVRYGPAVTTVQVPKATAYSELISVLLPKLGLPDHPVDAARLRPFDVNDGVAGPPYETQPESLLSSLPMHTGMDLVLETRSPEGTFPPAESFALTVLHFDPETLALGPPSLVELDFEDAAAARAFTVDDLAAQLGSEPSTLARVGKNNDLVWLDSVAGTTPAVTRLKIVSGASLIVDPSQDRSASTAWLEELRNTVTLRIRGSLAAEVAAGLGRDVDDGPGAAREYDALLAFDLRKTVGEFKNQVVDTIASPELTTSGFRVRLRRSSPELDNATILGDLGLYSGSSIWCERGMSVQPGQISITVYVAHDDPAFPFIPKGEVVMDRSAPLAELKQRAAAMAGVDNPELDRIRIRELLGEKPARIFSYPDATLDENLPDMYRSVDHVDVVAVQLDREEWLAPGHLLLEGYLLSPPEDADGVDAQEGGDNGRLSEVREIMIAGTATKDELVAEMVSVFEVDKGEEFELAKLFFKSQTKDLSWDVPASSSIVGSPWYLRDGDKVVIRNGVVARAREEARAAAAASGSSLGTHVEVALSIQVQTAEERAAYAALLQQEAASQ